MFDGTWKTVSGKLGTASIPLPDTTLHIQGDAYEVHSPDGVDTGVLQWGEAGAVQVVTLKGRSGGHAGNTIEAIIRVKGDLMQLCYAVDGSARPRSFEVESGQGVVTVRYRRVGPA